MNRGLKPTLGNSRDRRKIVPARAGPQLPACDIGRSILTTPGVPPEQLAALRSAFEAMLRDPDFIAVCEKRNLMVDGASGAEIDEIVRATLQLPQAVAEKIGQMMQ